ncbi:glucose-6-phosphate 1-epimerase [Abditibacterium utsteinense]|uniref:Putative glucose-6-phosphate 1-epimerase n=1 Tax=Abditibacterium utsteinense TaxID=1960156 RepID=A0A2S8SP96_9BACT|nr:D-hexose-6-phosphate mutarotase [Abditibacterium utsteinense]PQV62622.1 glucose-6-phosphate 1-epimerase [Abditibacterium utsteinense]
MNSLDISQLQSQFPTLRFDVDSGLPRAHFEHDGAKAEVLLQGAHVAQFETASGDHLLFQSRDPRFEAGKSFHNGVPVIFPWFGPKIGDPSAPGHGFVRTVPWEIENVEEDSLALKLESNEQTLAQWPHPFRLSYRVRLEAQKFQLQLQITNTGAEAFEFETALHTYFRVADVRNVEISGLDGKTYLDKTRGFSRHTQSGLIRIEQEVDRVYLDSSGPIILRDGARTLKISDLGGIKSTVVWNPWQEKGRNFGDLCADEWQQFVCIESGVVADDAVSLDAGKSYEMSVQIELEA